MRNYWAITKKELQALFVSPVAYVVLAVFFAVSGYFFYLILSTIIERVMQMMLYTQQSGMPPRAVDVPAEVMRSFFGLLSTVLLILLPAVTMGVFAEEKRHGTVELLFTSPVTNLQIILGKFTAVIIFFAVMLAPTILNSLILYFYSEPKPVMAPILAGYLGAFLLGGSLLAVGLFISSLTENQIVAFVVTFGAFIVLWVIDAMAGSGTTAANEILSYLSIINHYDDFVKGVLDTRHVVFYLSFIFLGLFLTSVSLDSVKWRQ